MTDHDLEALPPNNRLKATMVFTDFMRAQGEVMDADLAELIILQTAQNRFHQTKTPDSDAGKPLSEKETREQALAKETGIQKAWDEVAEAILVSGPASVIPRAALALNA